MYVVVMEREGGKEGGKERSHRKEDLAVRVVISDLS